MIRWVEHASPEEVTVEVCRIAEATAPLRTKWSESTCPAQQPATPVE